MFLAVVTVSFISDTYTSLIFLILKAWNTQSGAEFSLDGPVGQVYAMIFDKNILFAGTQVTYYH